MRKTTLTETRIDIADRHTTLYHLNGKKPPGKPLPLGSEVGYKGLYDKVINKLGIEYPDVSEGIEGAILYSLFPVFKDSESSSKKGFWRRYLGLAPDAEVAWSEALPFRCRIKLRVEAAAPSPIKVKVSVVPQVLLYAFGWSTWISVRVTGDHTVPELRQIVEHLAGAKAFTIPGRAGSFSVAEIFELIARGIRSDAFGGKTTHDKESSETAIVTTVLSKSGSSLSLGGLSVEDKDEEHIRHITRPGSLQSNHPLADLVAPLDWDTERNYIVMDKLGRFVWMEKLLVPDGLNRQRLECYHNNSFLTVVQAWHFKGLEEAAEASKPSTRLKPLLARAAQCLKDPPFRNASVVGFTQKLGA